MYLNSIVMNILKKMQPRFECMSFLEMADKLSESTFD